MEGEVQFDNTGMPSRTHSGESVLLDVGVLDLLVLDEMSFVQYLDGILLSSCCMRRSHDLLSAQRPLVLSGVMSYAVLSDGCTYRGV